MIKCDIHGYICFLDDEYKVRDNFALCELANVSDTSELPKMVFDDFVDCFLDMLQEFRYWYTKPMKINSCYRTKEFNKKVGGDERSRHLAATAVDWAIKGHTLTQRNNVKNKWKAICENYGVIGAINYYTNGYHLEAFSDMSYNQTSFVVRDYRGKKGDW